MKAKRFILMPVGFIVMLAGFSAIVMLLWNWLIPSIFGLTAITFWQALGLLVLARILFGGFGHGRRWMHGHGMHGHHNHIREKWMKMTDEERKEFIKKRRAHGCSGHHFFDERDMSFEPESRSGEKQ